MSTPVSPVLQTPKAEVGNLHIGHDYLRNIRLEGGRGSYPGRICGIGGCGEGKA